MTVATFDIVLLAVVIAMAIKGAVSGFVAEFFSKAALIVGAAGAVLLYAPLTPIVASVVGSRSFPEAISFLAIFLALYLAVKLAQYLVGTAFRGETMENLDRAIGLFLGIAEGVILVALILIALRAQPWFDTAPLVGTSLFARALEPLVSTGPGLFSGFVPR